MYVPVVGVWCTCDDIPILLCNTFTWHAEVFMETSNKFTHISSSLDIYLLMFHIIVWLTGI
jgi:hypothetical protein